MPSPLNGLMAPAASPTRTQFRPTNGPTENDIGSLPPRDSSSWLSAVTSQCGGAETTMASMSVVVLRSFQRWNVDRTPTPMLIVPSPMGNTQPYPGTVCPAASWRFNWLSMNPSVDIGLLK